MAEMS
jgi:large subunit GTPase 1